MVVSALQICSIATSLTFVDADKDGRIGRESEACDVLPVLEGECAGLVAAKGSSSCQYLTAACLDFFTAPRPFLTSLRIPPRLEPPLRVRTGDSLDEVKHRDPVSDRADHRVAIWREHDVPLAVHCPTQVGEAERGCGGRLVQRLRAGRGEGHPGNPSELLAAQQKPQSKCERFG